MAKEDPRETREPPSFISVSAPGKVILFGEHAVVYGKTAIAASLGLRTHLQIRSCSDDSVTLRLPNIQLPECRWRIADIPPLPTDLGDAARSAFQEQNKLYSPFLTWIQNCVLSMSTVPIVNVEGDDTKPDAETNHPQKAAVLAFWYLHYLLLTKEASASMDLSVQSELPVGAGLGSSASFSVCLAAGLLLWHGHIPRDAGEFSKEQQTKINAYAFLAESVIHGDPSGIDNTVCTFGGAIAYRKGQPAQPVPGFSSLQFLLTNTRIPRNTKRQVAIVRGYFEELPILVGTILNAIEKISDEFIAMFGSETSAQMCIEKEQKNKLEKLIDINHKLITSLGVGHPALERVCEVTREYGLHSKLTGAGGGGCALTLLPPPLDAPEAKRVLEKLEAQGFTCFLVQVGGPGVQQTCEK